ncbi:MAG TPA: cell wall-binding repeat-containing protein, partial [Euzebya sp.]|nr:cell wall-binding repeat-containing protein [Euzebya sp.]
MRPLALVTLLSLVAALLAAVPFTQRADAATTFSQAESGRVGGADSVATAIALSADTYDAAGTVVIARADDYADALAGAVLAAQLNAPILFTDTAALSAGVAEEIARLGATEAVILGGVAAVSQAVEDELAATVTTRRVAGDNRFATALAVADEVTTDTPDLVFFVEGEHVDPARGWPDAINVAALAAALGAPILPVNAEFVPPAIQAQWDAWAAEGASGLIVGGDAAVNPDTAAALAGEGDELGRLAGGTRFATSIAVYSYSVSEASMDPSVRYVIPGGSFVEGLAASLTTRRVAGENRFATALAVADEVVGEETPDLVFLVEGEHADPARGWPDAINVAALAAALGAPILPVNAEFVPPAIQAQWDAWAAEGASGLIVGGDAAVNPDTAAALAGE